MRVKIMLLLFFFIPLLLLIVLPIAVYSMDETGSRSTTILNTNLLKHGNVSDRARDFRSISLVSDIEKNLTNDDTMKSYNENFIKKRVAFITRDELIRKKRRRLKTLEMKLKDFMYNNQESDIELKRSKRSDDFWINGKIDVNDKILRMHALIVRDENVPECGVSADKVSKTRYFMCSGVILDDKHVLTSASCINHAVFNEFHINADLAVMIGILDKNPYVIKVKHYDMHQHYVADLNSAYNTENDVAVLQLACPIPRQSAAIPKLPSNAFQDVGHLCCPDKCKLLTVIQNAKNRHIIQELKMKHLPSPVHSDDGPNLHNDENSDRRSLKGYHKVQDNSIIDGNAAYAVNDSYIRRIRTPGKAPVPLYFTQEMADKLNPPNLNRHGNKSIDTNETIATGTKNNNETKENNNKTNIDWKSLHEEIRNENVSQGNREELSHFVKNALSDVMTKILEIMTRRVANIENTFENFQDILATQNINDSQISDEQVSDLIANTMLKMALKELYTIPDNSTGNKDNTTDLNSTGKSSEENGTASVIVNKDTNIDLTPMRKSNEENLNATDDTEDVLNDDEIKPRLDDENETRKDENTENENVEHSAAAKLMEETKPEEEKKIEINSDFELNVDCPPLGSPIFANNTLIALIAYTCDDLQNWVEWKYVEIVHNLKWIRQQMKRKTTSEQDFNSHNEIND